MTKIAIFDMGGTLQDSYPLYDYMPSLFPEVDKEKLLIFTKAEFKKLNNQIEFITIEEKLKNVLKNVSIKFSCKDISGDAKKLLFMFYLDRSVLFDDAVLLLDYLKENNVKLILASDADTLLLKRVLKKHNLKKYFNKIFNSEELKAYKSSVKFKNVLKNILPDNYNKNEIIFVGDTEVDMITAIQLDVTSILINKSKDHKNFNQDFTITNLKEIINISRGTVL
ncbi:MAG: HAD family hydrolase [Spirochaetes bacterium]|nr:HAD family hydrolase [Spirochaetota bacterium]